MKHLIIMACVLFASIALVGIPAATASEPQETIESRLGTIAGLRENDVVHFRGVRYAQPPTGERRFMPPVASGPWEDTFDATTWPNRCMQPAGGVGGGAGPTNEDCLFLNVVTPSVEDDRRPVLFWIHGGAYTQGSANEYDGSVLATQGDVVVVTINYRLGLFGFVELSALGPKFAGSASNGFRDQILALEWVRDNIADYGGDPNNVTIFGESAGGGSVLALLAAPSADGLYHKAIAHSPPPVSQAPENKVPVLSKLVEASGKALVSKLQSLSADEILGYQQTVGATGGSVDGTVVTRSANEAIVGRGADGVPLITGTNRDEGTLFTMLMPPAILEPMEAGLAMSITNGANPAPYLSALELAYPDDTAKQRNERIWVDMFRIAAIGAAQRASQAGPGGWLYRFDLPSTQAMGGVQLGATHAAEIAFTFNSFAGGQSLLNLYDGKDPVVRGLAANWSNTVLAFAKTGNPNGSGLPQWPRYRSEQRQTMMLDAKQRVEGDIDRDQIKLWESVGVTP